jgi:hypothetical protein
MTAMLLLGQYWEKHTGLSIQTPKALLTADATNAFSRYIIKQNRGALPELEEWEKEATVLHQEFAWPEDVGDDVHQGQVEAFTDKLALIPALRQGLIKAYHAAFRRRQHRFGFFFAWKKHKLDSTYVWRCSCGSQDAIVLRPEP